MTFDPTKPVRTRDGRNARIVCTDVNNSMPIIALIKDEDGREWIAHYGIGGNVYGYSQDKSDLVNIPERIERWANVYVSKMSHVAGPWLSIYPTEDAAIRSASSTDPCSRIKLIFEDDSLVDVTVEKE